MPVYMKKMCASFIKNNKRFAEMNTFYKFLLKIKKKLIDNYYEIVHIFDYIKLMRKLLYKKKKTFEK